MRAIAGLCIATGALLGLALGCHSSHVEAVVENRTGAVLQLEVDYPNASFGKNALAPNAEYRYRFQIGGSGRLKVIYTMEHSDVSVQIEGPELKEGEEGQLEIVLLPEGKAEFHPRLIPKPR